MAEYIERKTAIAVACKGCNKQFSNEPCEPSECYIQQGLFNVTAVDVVEVVRCRDCKHRYTLSSGMSFCKEKFQMGAIDDDFCSYGERREGE